MTTTDIACTALPELCHIDTLTTTAQKLIHHHQLTIPTTTITAWLLTTTPTHGILFATDGTHTLNTTRTRTNPHWHITDHHELHGHTIDQASTRLEQTTGKTYRHLYSTQ